jgi:hypothetical protein
MIRPSTVRLLVVALPLALAGCGLPDLVAHTVKSVEHSREGRTEAANQPAQQPSAQPAVARQAPAEEPPPPMATAVPRRSTITVEALPER